MSNPNNRKQTEQQEINAIRQHWAKKSDEELWLNLGSDENDTRTIGDLLLDEISRQGELERRGLTPPFFVLRPNLEDEEE